MRARSPHRRPALVCALALLSALGACGEPDPPEPLASLLSDLYRKEEAELEDLIQTIGQRGRKDPETVVPALVEALREERRNPLVNELRFHVALGDAVAEQDKSEALREISNRMARRLAVFGYAPGTFEVVTAEEAVRLRVARPRGLSTEDERRYMEVMAERLAAPGSYELRIETVPPEEGAPVPSLWTASRKSFDVFVEREAARLREAIRERRRYVPSRPDFQVSVVRPATAKGQPGLAVLSRPLGADERFDHESLTLRAGKHESTGDLVLELTIDASRRDALAAWSAAHRGRRLAFVLNGRTELFVPLEEPLGESFRLHLGSAQDPRTNEWLKGMLRAIAEGAHAFPVRSELLTEVPKDAVTPIVRCLAAVGEPAAPYLLELVRGGGHLGARAQLTLEYLRRSLTTGD